MEAELVHLVDEIEHSKRHIHGFHRLRRQPSIIWEDGHAPVLFVDLDNTLYPSSSPISMLMSSRISLYFQHFLDIPKEESIALGHTYYKDYGLAIRGLVKHFGIDPLEYDAFVDGGLPLEDLLSPDERLIALLSKCKARLFIFTNAGLKHALRVLTLLNLLDLFEAICYCDYKEEDFPAKPDHLAFERAMHHAGIRDRRACYFADDSGANVRAARRYGWSAVLVGKDNEYDGEDIGGVDRIESVHDLDQVFPELFLK